jgi:hypothetical protein
MPREGAVIFRELVGKIEVFGIECDKCGRRRRYHLYRLIERYGIDTPSQAIRLARRNHGELSAQAGEEFERSMRYSHVRYITTKWALMSILGLGCVKTCSDGSPSRQSDQGHSGYFRRRRTTCRTDSLRPRLPE